MSKSAFSRSTIGPRKSSEYGTPLDFYNKLNSIFKFILDPCAFESENRLGTKYHYTKADDGLRQDWEYNTFINPPFGTKKGEQVVDWIRKFRESAVIYRYTYVMLLPTRLESNWFQDELWLDQNTHIYIVKGRLKFYNPETNKNNDPHPIGSMLIIAGRNITTDMFDELRRTIPGIFITDGNY